MRNQKLLLEDILTSINIIDSQMKNADEIKFKEDIHFQDVVIRRLSIIGEAYKNISKELKTKHKEVNWREIAGMRDFIIHEYFELNLDVIWKTIVEDLPVLKGNVTNMLKELR